MLLLGQLVGWRLGAVISGSLRTGDAFQSLLAPYLRGAVTGRHPFYSKLGLAAGDPVLHGVRVLC